MVRNDRVIWSSCMVACGDADGAVTGNTRRFGASLEKIKQVVEARSGEIMFGLNLVVHKGKTIFVADTSVHEYPTSEQMSEIAISAARVVRLFGFDPKVAFVSHSTFGQPVTSRTKHIRKAVDILKEKNIAISMSNINLIINRCNGDRENLLKELTKLEHYTKNGKKITSENISKLTNLTENHSITELVDNCLAKNKKQTINILNENNQSPEDNIVIIKTFLYKLKQSMIEDFLVTTKHSC